MHYLDISNEIGFKYTPTSVLVQWTSFAPVLSLFCLNPFPLPSLIPNSYTISKNLISIFLHIQSQPPSPNTPYKSQVSLHPGSQSHFPSSKHLLSWKSHLVSVFFLLLVTISSQAFPYGLPSSPFVHPASTFSPISPIPFQCARFQILV